MLLFINSPFRKLVLRFSISSETSGKLKNVCMLMSGLRLSDLNKETTYLLT